MIAIGIRHHVHDIDDDLSLLFQARLPSAVHSQEILRDPWDLSWTILHSQCHEPEGDDMILEGI